MIMSPPVRPAWVLENPLGPTMSSIHVVTALNIPRPTKKTTISSTKSLLRRVCFSPSRHQRSALPGPRDREGVGGCSLATAKKTTAATMATIP